MAAESPYRKGKKEYENQTAGSKSTANKPAASKSSRQFSPDDVNPYRHIPKGETAAEAKIRRQHYYSWQHTQAEDSGNTDRLAQIDQKLGQPMENPDTAQVDKNILAGAPVMAAPAGRVLGPVVGKIVEAVGAALKASQNAPKGPMGQQRPQGSMGQPQPRGPWGGSGPQSQGPQGPPGRYPQTPAVRPGEQQQSSGMQPPATRQMPAVRSGPPVQPGQLPGGTPGTSMVMRGRQPAGGRVVSSEQSPTRPSTNAISKGSQKALTGRKAVSGGKSRPKVQQGDTIGRENKSATVAPGRKGPQKALTGGKPAAKKTSSRSSAKKSTAKKTPSRKKKQT